MSRRIERARERLISLVEKYEGRVDRAVRDFADELAGLTPDEIKEVIASASRAEATRFVSMLREGIEAAKRQGAYCGAAIADTGGHAAARWLMANQETITARFAKHIHTQGRAMSRDLVGSIARVQSEGQSAIEAARQMRDVVGHVPAVKITKLTEDVAQGARKMVLAVGDEATIEAYRVDLARMRRHADRLGAMHETSGQLAYGMRSAAQQYIREIERAVRMGRTDLIDRAVEYQGYHKRAYAERRIARTEMTRGFGEALIETSKEAPWVVGHKWKLSPRHRVRDICDVNATQNLHGMGPGCYPLDKFPEYPAHPLCMCLIEPIIDDTVE